MLRLAGGQLIANGQLPKHLGVSTARGPQAGLLIGGGLGLAMGLLTGLSPLADRFLDTSVQMVRTIPHLALIPLVILWFGIDEQAKLFLIALGVFFPMYINTYHGIRAIDPGLVEMARMYDVALRHVPAQEWSYPARVAVDPCRLAVCAGNDVVDVDRGRDDFVAIRPGLSGDERARVHANRRRAAGDRDLCRNSGKALRQLRALARRTNRAVAAEE